MIDPLSSKTTQAEIDPLSRALAAAITSTKKESTDEFSSTITDTFEPWSSKKSVILSQYNTTKKISMTTAMNNTNEESVIDNTKSTIYYKTLLINLCFSLLVSDMTTTSERIKNRLEQLDAFEVKLLVLIKEYF
jgi:DNA transposition AAA+ family ATPase